MARALLGLVESDSEDDLGGVRRGGAPAAAAANLKKGSIRDMPASKRGRPAASRAPAGATAAAAAAAEKSGAVSAAASSKVTKPAHKPKKTAGATALAKRGRPALADRTNEQLQEIAATTAAAAAQGKRGRGRPPRVAGRPAVVMGSGAENEDALPMADKDNSASAAKPAASRRKTPASEQDVSSDDEAMGDEGEDDGHGNGNGSGQQSSELPDTQSGESMHLDFDDNEAERHSVPTFFGKPTAFDMSPRPQLSPVRDGQRRQQQQKQKQTASFSFLSPSRGQRAVPAADGESDLSLRRRLGEMSSKYDMLESRYRDLREIGIKEAERNFDRLRRSGDERVKVSDDLIASLKADIAHYRDLAKDGARVRRDYEASEARASDLQRQVTELSTALSDARVEAKTLSAKLAAARSTASAVEGLAGGGVAVGPGSAIKAHHHHHGAGTAATTAAAAAAAAAELAQLKEDLYGDLTGLLVRSVKREASRSASGSATRQVYDCIQTGRNGSLHFKLSIDSGGKDGSGADATSAYNDIQFVYMPQLDASRDADLIDQLPDYLVEEISFPRVQAAKFYKRVMQSLA